MSLDLDLLKIVIKTHQENPLNFILHINSLEYPLEDVSIKNSPTPVNTPTTRGGVYFSDKYSYKVKGILRDISAIPLLSKTMLGPNTDFHEIKITTHLILNDKKQNISLFTNLTNSVQHPSQIELNMILVKIESS